MKITRSRTHTTGIYKITCAANGRAYVGASVNIESRWRMHRHKLNNQRHTNKEFQNDWNKYGAGAFAFEVVKECEAAQLLKVERAAMAAQMIVSGVSLYNRHWGFEVQPRTNKPRKVLCVTTGETYRSITEAARKTGTNYRHLHGCLNGEEAHTGRSTDGKPLQWQYITTE